MKLLRKAICISLAATMSLGLTACGGKANDNKTGVNSTVNKIEVAKEESAESTFGSDSSFSVKGLNGSMQRFIKAGDFLYVVMYDSASDASSTDATSTDSTFDGVVTPDDNKCLVYKVSVSDGNAESVYETADENKGESISALIEGFDGSCYFVTTKGNGGTIYKIADGTATEIGDASKLNPQGGEMTAAVVDKDGNFISINESGVKACDSSLNEISGANATEMITNIAIDANGDPIVQAYDFSDENNSKLMVMKYDVQGGKFTDSYELDASDLINVSPITKGTDGYDFYYATSSSVFGFKYEGAVATKIVNFGASNINGTELNCVYMLDASSFVMNSIDFNGKDYGLTDLKKYTKMDPSQVSEKSTFTLATLYGYDGLKQAVIDFNESQSDVRIELVDYSESTDPEAKLSADIAAGTTPDFYELSNGVGDMSMRQVIAKGMLEDLNPYLEKDESLSKEDFIPSIYDAMQTDGKMYFAAPYAMVHTVMGKTSEIGEDIGWNFTEIKSYVDTKPEDARVFNSTNKMETFDSLSLTCISDFVDWEKGECHFDSDDFKAMLEICNRGSNEEADWGALANENRVEVMKSGKQLLMASSISPSDMDNYKRMFGEEITFKGTPNLEKKGNQVTFELMIGMSAQCENKDAAWKFMSYLLSKDYQGKDYAGMPWFPIREDVYADYVKSCTCTEGYTDEFGNAIEPRDEVIEATDFTWEYKPVSQETMDEFRGLVDSVSGTIESDNKIAEICKEEIAAYFSGEKSLDDVCAVIQDRATTYVNESK